MKRRVSLKKGTIYLLSASMLQPLSAVPTMAENTVVESNTELETYTENTPDMTTASSATEPTTVLETVVTTETETTVAPVQSQESLPEETTTQIPETEPETVETTSSEQTKPGTEAPTTAGQESGTETTPESTVESSETETSDISESVTEDSTEDLTTEEETEEESSEEESTEAELGKGVEETFYSKAYMSVDAPIYAGWKDGSATLTSLPAGYPVYVTSLVLFNDEPVWARIMFDVNDYSSEGYVRVDSLQIDYSSNIALMDADESQSFPADYQAALNALHQAHPNWIFKPIYVGDTFSYAISEQMSTPARALVNMYYNEGYRSLLDRDYDWRTNSWKQWEPNWAAASEETVRYYMDPRNFLNENDIFMFESLTYESYQNQAAVEAAIANTFMSNANVPGTNHTYSWLFCWIGEKYNINPVALASRVRQEQGAGNSAMISGTYAGYEGLYNYFNIQATGSTRDEILQNGLKEARTGSTMMLPDGTVSTGSWDTPEKALIGGSLKFANHYILRNQNTLYAQKFDYDGAFNGKYWHQYMTNIMAAYSEGNQVGRSYRATGQTDNNIVFLIPVYDERPESSPKPAERKNQNRCINSLTVNDQEVIGTFSKDQRDFYFNVDADTTSADIQVKAAADTSSVQFNNIGDLKHKVEVTKITVTAEDGSSTTYRLIVGNGVEITEGFFDGFDVEAYRKRYPKLSRKYGDDLDAYYEHYLLTGKEAGWDGSANGPFPQAAIHNGVDYSPVFDATYYLNKYADLKAAFGNDASAALNHFVNYGIKEGRQACEDFNVNTYKNNYEDLRKAFGSNNSLYVSHYLEYGLKEGREAQKVLESAKPDDKKDESSAYVPTAEEKKYAAVYDYTFYKNGYEDLRKAFGNDSSKYFEHFLQHGMTEGRQACKAFDVRTYKENYADLRKVFGDNNVLYYKHYIEYGQKEGRNAVSTTITGNISNKTDKADDSTSASIPAIYKGIDYSPVYNYEYYKKSYADLRAAFGNDEKKYLQHFVENGMAEGRQATATFNLTAYKNRYADLRAAFGSNNVSYYMHYITNGKAEGRNAAN